MPRQLHLTSIAEAAALGLQLSNILANTARKSFMCTLLCHFLLWMEAGLAHGAGMESVRTIPNAA